MKRSELLPVFNLFSDVSKRGVVGSFSIKRSRGNRQGPFIPVGGTLGRFLVQRRDVVLDLLFCDWGGRDDWYICSYPKFEIRHFKDGYFSWTYSPNKQDGRNLERKTIFVNEFGSATLKFKIPLIPRDLPDFFEALGRLIAVREHIEKMTHSRRRMRRKISTI
jgi:hypothetical protein